MSIDTRFMPAIRNALLEKMQDDSDRYRPVAEERADVGQSLSDSVSLSADALRVHASIDTAAGQDIYDAERVAEIRQALSTGTFSIDATRIADKFHRFNNSL